MLAVSAAHKSRRTSKIITNKLHTHACMHISGQQPFLGKAESSQLLPDSVGDQQVFVWPDIPPDTDTANHPAPHPFTCIH